MSRLLISFTLILLLSCTRLCRAQLLLDFNPAGQSGVPGMTLTFNATITHAGNVTLYLNGANSFIAGGLALDLSSFLNNAPLSMDPGDTWTGNVFTITSDMSAQPGDYPGSLTITGGTDSMAQDDLVTQNFLVIVQSSSTVPEPGNIALLLSLTISGGLLLARRSKQR